MKHTHKMHFRACRRAWPLDRRALQAACGNCGSRPSQLLRDARRRRAFAHGSYVDASAWEGRPPTRAAQRSDMATLRILGGARSRSTLARQPPQGRSGARHGGDAYDRARKVTMQTLVAKIAQKSLSLIDKASAPGAAGIRAGPRGRQLCMGIPILPPWAQYRMQSPWHIRAQLPATQSPSAKCR